MRTVRSPAMLWEMRSSKLASMHAAYLIKLSPVYNRTIQTKLLGTSSAVEHTHGFGVLSRQSRTIHESAFRQNIPDDP